MEKLIFEAKLGLDSRSLVSKILINFVPDSLTQHNPFRKYFVVRETHDTNAFDSGVARDSTPYSFQGVDFSTTKNTLLDQIS